MWGGWYKDKEYMSIMKKSLEILSDGRDCPDNQVAVFIDEKGYAEFIDIPYGWYTITESKSIEYVDIMDPQPLYIAKDKQKLYYIVQDPRNRRNLKIVKRDEETNKIIPPMP